MSKITTKYVKIGDRDFVQLGNHCIPIDSIEEIDSNEAWATSSNNRVAIYYKLDGAVAKAGFQDAYANTVRQFLGLGGRLTSD